MIDIDNIAQRPADDWDGDSSLEVLITVAERDALVLAWRQREAALAWCDRMRVEGLGGRSGADEVAALLRADPASSASAGSDTSALAGVGGSAEIKVGGGGVANSGPDPTPPRERSGER